MFLVGFVTRIDGLHAEVETKYEIAEVHPQSDAVGYCHLLPQAAGLELTARLVGIVAESPHIAGIDEEGSLELPEEVATQFGIEVNLHVTRLVDEVDAAVFAGIASGTERAHTPSANAVGTAREIAFLEGQHIAVTIRHSNTDTGMEGKTQRRERTGRLVGIHAKILTQCYEARIIDVELGILRKSYAEGLVVAIVVLGEFEDVCQAIKQIARRLDIRLDGVVSVGVCDAITHLHDEEVFVVIPQYGITVGIVVEIVTPEGIGYPRH